jgi:hypothetical protein
LRRRRTELREAFAGGFAEYFFAVGETIGGQQRALSASPACRARDPEQGANSGRPIRTFQNAEPGHVPSQSRVIEVQPEGCAAKGVFASEAAMNME